MNAGFSQDTGNEFLIPITEPPIVEIDTEATAAYIRLRTTKVAHTEPYASDSALVMVDFDAEGNVVGIEVIGQYEFSIRELIKAIPKIQASDSILNRTRYVSVKKAA